MSLNETWMEDDCTTCICRDGQSKCQASFCRTPCLQPRKVPGECCPVCDDDCHLQCLYGRAVDSSGRELCECRKVPDEDFRDLQVTIQTKVIDRAEGVDGQEADGDFVTAGANEAINCPRVPCKRMCAHGFQTDERGCPICKCQRCKSIQPCHKKCALGLVHDGRGCPTCHCRPGVSSSTSPSQNGGATRQPVMTSSFSVSSSSNGKCLAGGSNLTFYNYGDRWQMDDCTHCVCHPGGPTCTEMACPLPCHNAIFVPGQCCPVCGDGSRTSTIPTGGSSTGQQRNSDESRDGMADGTALLTVVLVCVALVAGLILIVAILAVCVARQCQRLQLHEENMAAAAVKLTAVNRLRPKSTNLDYQYNLYLHRYRETVPGNGWPFDGSSDSQDKDEGGSSQCSNSPLLMVKSA
ncbi:hypothetical protein DAPPUDRAFT_313009 [Daphnia pulex]|uniref:VWFC domain-containing protein n=1 Tax=Daphnia pulex TaxID=6669 RepID=E9G196_DAPPU|nr:hypothetical protein DAPPUDRAFT_313009 [Daphnia pulex]|eukprot:EFX86679.1 hypothetical protein DAPPUDRAFT_313009 [Daphnia pulex]